jgi:hypothetical protein
VATFTNPFNQSSFSPATGYANGVPITQKAAAVKTAIDAVDLNLQENKEGNFRCSGSLEGNRRAVLPAQSASANESDALHARSRVRQCKNGASLNCAIFAWWSMF